MKFKKNIVDKKNKCLFILLVLFFLLFFNLIEKIQIIKKEKNNRFVKKCYLSFENSNLKIIHTIITRFIYSFQVKSDSRKE